MGRPSAAEDPPSPERYGAEADGSYNVFATDASDTQPLDERPPQIYLVRLVRGGLEWELVSHSFSSAGSMLL